jgi:hypothetical protein
MEHQLTAHPRSVDASPELSSGGGTRTHNPAINSRVLYQLSYPGTNRGIYRLADPLGPGYALHQGGALHAEGGAALAVAGLARR